MTALVFADKAAIAPELLCAVCKEPWRGQTAVTCPSRGCQVAFCADCAEDRVQKDATCPTCGADISTGDGGAVVLPAVHKKLRAISDATVEVLCPFKVGCWRGPWGFLAAHVDSCPHNPSRVACVTDAPDDLKCPICHELLSEPISTSCCQEVFCSGCVTAALQRRAECPHCRASLTEDQLQEPPAALVRMVAATVVHCAARCGWTGRRDELAEHMASCTAADVAAAAKATPTPAEPAACAAATIDGAVTGGSATGGVPLTAAAAAPAAAPAAPGRATMDLFARSDVPQLAAADATQVVTTMAHIAAPEPTEEMRARRKQLHVSAVMDVSGSMRGEKLRLAKESLAFVAAELQQDDRFGLIAFDNVVEEVHRMTPMSDAGRLAALSSIRSLRDRGSTNLSGGLFAGINQARGQAFSGGCEPTARMGGMNPTLQATRQRRANVHADPAAASAPSLLGRMRSMFSAAPTSSSQCTVSPSSAAATAPPPPAPVVVPFGAFTLRVSCNASAVKCNGSSWKGRFAFEIVGGGAALPSGVSHVAVIHPEAGRIALRGRASFPSIDGCKARFGVEVYRDATGGLPPARHVVFAVEVDANDTDAGPAVFAFDVPRYDDPRAAAAVPTPAASTAVAVADASAAAATAAAAGLRPADEAARIVLLFTDGNANAGITDAASLVARTKEIVGAGPDVTVFTFGFGSGHNATLLQQLAELSQGTYYFVQKAAELKEIFADCIGGLLSMVASGIELTVTPAIGVRIQKVLTQFPVRDGPSPGTKIIAIKDLYAEEQRDVLVRVEVAPRQVGAAAPVVTFSLACDNIVLGRRETAAATVALPTAAEAYGGALDSAVDEQLNRYNATEALAEAQKMADAGDVGRANLQLRQMRAQLMNSATAASGVTVELTRDLERAEAATSTTAVWQQEGQKRVSQMKSSHGMQRSNCVDAAGSQAYSTKAKAQSRAKANR